MANLSVPPPKFEARKKDILDQLSVPTTEYTDASPKGSVDEGIRDLIAEINGYAGYVTTSSCAGRVSVFLEGKKKGAVAPADGLDAEVGGPDEAPSDGGRLASAGGKGGGSWLFVSHDPIDAWAQSSKEDFSWTSFLGLGPGEEAASGMAGQDEAERLVHFKFEPMVQIRPLSFCLSHKASVYPAKRSSRFCTS
jgi:tRNA wybutosine-synthesizing protein 3